jgi:hypothetical protein
MQSSSRQDESLLQGLVISVSTQLIEREVALCPQHQQSNTALKKNGGVTTVSTTTRTVTTQSIRGTTVVKSVTVISVRTQVTTLVALASSNPINNPQQKI